MKKLVQTILPRIALYKTLIDSNYSKGKANEYMKKYMLETIAAKKHASIVKMEKVPGFYSIYSKIFLKIICKTDLQKSTQNHYKNHFDVTYGGLKKIGFTRTKTLGYGGDCCDFHFYKKK